MKNTLFLTLLTFLIACQMPTSSPSSSAITHQVIIKNSLWQTVSTQAFSVPAKDASPTDPTVPVDVQNQITVYNASTLEDFERAYIDTAPDLSNAPPVNVYICNPETNNPNMVVLNVARQSLVDNYAGWKIDSQGQILYIDHIPPPPILDKNVNPYAYYALYVVDTDTGAIVFEDHCGFQPDQSFNSNGGLLDPNGVDTYYGVRLSAFNTAVGSPVEDAQNNIHVHCHVVSRTIYVVPTVPSI